MKRMWLHTLIGIDPSVPLKPGQLDASWYYEHKKNDLDSFFTHWELKSYDSVGSVFTVAGNIGGTAKNEFELLAGLWDELNMIANYHTISGWRMTDVVWPKLINRSIHLNLEVPQNFKLMGLQPMKRFSEGGFYDLYNVYKQGIYSRPDVELHAMLEFWTGQGTQAEHVMAFAHAGNLRGIDIIATLDQQIDLMEKTARAYDT